jgi:DNA-binding winged helix-turn-helix (wHTH) protein
MVHRFATFEIDAGTREVRAGGRILRLQPRIFDLLLYLASHRERVVPKDELLARVWPGVIVTDASLQRAVSLARSALAAAGAPDAIRTFSRQGYRMAGDSEEPASGAGGGGHSPAIAAARAAYLRGEWGRAMAAFRRVDDIDGLSAEDLQRWAHAAQCAGRPHAAAEPLERAVAAFSTRGDRRRAAWVAILLAQLRLEWRETVLANGWYQRATRLLENEPPGREKGYLDLLGARMALLRNDLESTLTLGEQARRAGEKLADPDLESLGLVHVGEAKLYLGDVRAGLAALDEAGASVVGSGLSAWAGGLVYCGVIYGCLTRADWHRAGQWTDQFTRWCEGKGVAGYPGLCRLHRAEVLSIRGDLRAAEKECRATIAVLGKQAPWAEGDAWMALGDILLAKGECGPAREAYLRATELGWESRLGLALVHFAEGNAAAAAKLLGRTLADDGWSCRSKRGQALAWHAIISAHAGKLGEARAALHTLKSEPEAVSTPALQALVARARGEVAAAAGRRTEAIGCLRDSLRQWQRLHAPVPAAQVRCRIADLLDAEGDAETAALERTAAFTAFEQAGANAHIRACTILSQFAARRCAKLRLSGR